MTSADAFTGVVNESGNSSFAVRDGRFISDNQLQYTSDKLGMGTALINLTLSADGNVMVGTVTGVSGSSTGVRNYVFKRVVSN